MKFHPFLALWLLSVGAVSAATFQGLGNLGGSYSQAFGISGDGSTVVGWSGKPGLGDRPFRWTEAEGMIDLGSFGGTVSQGLGASENGTVVVGYSRQSNNQAHPFRWTAETGMVDLGTFGGTAGQATTVTPNGQIVAGWAQTAGGNLIRAFRWTEGTGMIELGTVGGTYSQATAISADGNTIVGISTDATNHWRAFRWTASGGIVNLGQLNNAQISAAMGVSADGSVVVGYNSDLGSKNRAFRWTIESGMIDLGTLGGAYSQANAISGDGLMTVGWSLDSAGVQIASFWLGTEIFSLGADLALRFPELSLAGWDHLTTITAISGNAVDGYNLAGWGQLPDGTEQAFRITGFVPVPEPATGGLLAGSALVLLARRRRH